MPVPTTANRPSSSAAFLLSLLLLQSLVQGFVAPSANERNGQRLQQVAPQRLWSHRANNDNQSPSPRQGDQRSTITTTRTTTRIQAPSSSAAAAATVALTPLESWFVDSLQSKYNEALLIKCPFFRRRAADILDATDMLIRFLIVRHKSLPLQPPGWRCEGDTTLKRMGLSHQELLEVIRNDWRPDTCKGYYITGRLDRTVYRDDCVFDGPDPDLPVRGLRKYLNAASQLFDHQQSRSELLSLRVVEDDASIVATWKMKGVLRLPWRPSVPTWTGSTTYYTDEDGLIYRHIETWDKSVMQAFLQTLWPEVADRIWERAAE